MSVKASGRVVVSQQPDGWWRWRFHPSQPDASPLVSAEAFPEADEAVESARQAYPTLYPHVQSPSVPRHRLRRFGRAMLGGVAAVVVVGAAARAGNRRTPPLR